mmetsp:Transcript_3407/g.7053  ORF Transcript_3407/g.7053 Transcript_3407/m.7053 type:complete len:284 (-) Transcript_3407:135-986(-)
MFFVKSSVYKQEITDKGIKEKEVDSRSKDEKKVDEALRSRPEFSRDAAPMTLMELKESDPQAAAGVLESAQRAAASDKQYPGGLPSVTEEDMEFYQGIEKEQRKERMRREKEERDAMAEFEYERQRVLNKPINHKQGKTTEGELTDSQGFGAGASAFSAAASRTNPASGSSLGTQAPSVSLFATTQQEPAGSTVRRITGPKAAMVVKKRKSPPEEGGPEKQISASKDHTEKQEEGQKGPAPQKRVKESLDSATDSGGKDLEGGGKPSGLGGLIGYGSDSDEDE